MYCTTHIRPRSSNMMFTGCRALGSAAESWMSNPGGAVSALRASSGGRPAASAIDAAIPIHPKTVIPDSEFIIIHSALRLDCDLLQHIYRDSFRTCKRTIEETQRTTP